MNVAEFKHISVTPADEEDEVIRAGLPSVSGEGTSASQSGPDGEGTPASQPGSDTDGTPVSQSELVHAGTPVSSPGPDVENASGMPAVPDGQNVSESTGAPMSTAPSRQMGAQGQPAKRRAGKADSYRETTLDDLKPEPMSSTQKIVIIAAVICIIGALAFYLAFMR